LTRSFIKVSICAILLLYMFSHWSRKLGDKCMSFNYGM
jgi:hypothetical protein